MKTAVQWLVEQYLERKGFLKTSDIDQALEMEKEQHNVTWKESRIVKAIDEYHEKETSFDDYYLQTFNKE